MLLVVVTWKKIEPHESQIMTTKMVVNNREEIDAFLRAHEIEEYEIFSEQEISLPFVIQTDMCRVTMIYQDLSKVRNG